MAHAVAREVRTSVATIVAVAPAGRLDETAATLEALRTGSAVRTILVTLGEDPQPVVHTDADTTVVTGIVPRYLNNVVASLRLSSLPSMAWWRGGDAGVLGGLATLVDRLVLDSEDPLPDWSAAVGLAERAAISDLRWTRLTRWRNLMAQFFDGPDVHADAASLTSLDIVAADAHAARLFAAWITTSLPHGEKIEVSIADSPAGHFMHSIFLNGPRQTIRLELLPSHTCVETSIVRATQPLTTRVVPLGDQSPARLLAEELRIRSRDEAFERAMRDVVAR